MWADLAVHTVKEAGMDSGEASELAEVSEDANLAAAEDADLMAVFLERLAVWVKREVVAVEVAVLGAVAAFGNSNVL